MSGMLLVANDESCALLLLPALDDGRAYLVSGNPSVTLLIERDVHIAVCSLLTCRRPIGERERRDGCRRRRAQHRLQPWLQRMVRVGDRRHHKPVDLTSVHKRDLDRPVRVHPVVVREGCRAQLAGDADSDSAGAGRRTRSHRCGTT
eukprot:3579088-Prymnesium_polylepis.1